MKKIILLCMLIAAMSGNSSAQGVLGKIKQKAGQVGEKVLDKKIDEKVEGESGSSGSNSGSSEDSAPGAPSKSKNRPVNKSGAGLVSTPPDVKQNLTEVETAYKSASYNESRRAIQQAMLGVEMEIGKEILKKMPEKVAGCPKDTSADQVTSTGWGWAGLTIYREYTQEDKQLRTTIANNAVMLNAMNMYLSNGGYAQTTGGEQKWKQTKVKTYKAIIEYDENSGYKLTVPLGQSSMIVWEGVNFATEADMIAAASTFDIDGIKKTLGEQ